MDDHFERMLGLGGRSSSDRPSYTLKSEKGPAFQPAKQWQGPKPGFVFKRGVKGVGYYEDFEEMKKARLAGLLHDGSEGPAGAKRRRMDEEGAAVAGSGGKEEGQGEDDEAELIRKALESDDIDEETIKKILEAADKQLDVVELDLPGVKKLFLNLEKKIQSNLLKRVKFADEPSKFVDSELELFEEISNFKAIAAAPSLYPELVKLNVADSLLGLVTHENTDISIAMLAALGELTDPDVILEAEKEAITLIDSLVEKNGLELLVQNLQRMDESRDEDVKGVHSTLQVLENLCTVKPSLCSQVCEKTGLLRVLVTRVKAKRFDEIKAYCAELLAILLAADTENQRRLGQLSGMNGMDSLLQAIAYYRRREAASPEELECIENLFDGLSSTLLVPENQARFRKSEGLDLMLRCIREKKGGFLGAIKALDSALMNSAPNCEKFVDLSGLKAIFPLYMGRGWGTALKGKRQGEKEALSELVVSTVASLCMLLVDASGTSEAEARLVSKFLEGEGEKVDHAVEVFVKYFSKVEAAREAIAEGGEEEQWAAEGATEEEKAEARLDKLMDAGLYMLQRVSVILGFVWTHSIEGRERVKKRMRMEGRGLGEIADILREYAKSLGQEAQGAVAEGGGIAQQKARLLAWAIHLEEGDEERKEAKAAGALAQAEEAEAAAAAAEGKGNGDRGKERVAAGGGSSDMEEDLEEEMAPEA